MRMKLALRLTAIPAAALIALSFNDVAQAIVDTAFNYKTPKTGWYGLSPGHFTPRDRPTANSDYQISFTELRADSASAISHPCFFTTVNLPNGAKITAVTIWYSSDTAGSVIAGLTRNNVATGATEFVGQQTSTNAGQTRKSMNFIVIPGKETVNNQQFVYQVGFCMDSPNDRFYAGRINYTYTNAGD